MMYKSEVIRRMQHRFNKKPWSYKFKIYFKVKMWFWKMNIRHYWNWCTSKEYRQSYGECTFYSDYCYKDNMDTTDPYCKNNPRCTIKKSGLFYIEA